jgi:hypothetical protein
MTAAAVLVAGTVSVVARQAAPAASPDQDWKPTEIKNLTVLPKDTSPDDVMKIMREWNAALNVDCVFCHVGQIGKPLSTFDFAADTKKRKEVSRVMVKAAIAMNETFKTVSSDDPPTVQCSTCHKRSRHVDADLPPEKPKGDEQHD